jgi:hypothetical protein
MESLVQDRNPLIPLINEPFGHVHCGTRVPLLMVPTTGNCAPVFDNILSEYGLLRIPVACENPDNPVSEFTVHLVPVAVGALNLVPSLHVMPILYKPLLVP